MKDALFFLKPSQPRSFSCCPSPFLSFPPLFPYYFIPQIPSPAFLSPMLLPKQRFGVLLLSPMDAPEHWALR